jgi:hypothetical protein
MSDTPSLLTAPQFADQAGVSTSTVQKWLRSGKIRGVKQNGKWMIAAEQLEKPATDPPEKPRSETGEKSIRRATGYSLDEFSAMTYLTVYGVERYLKEGRLIGTRGTDGCWRIDPDCLAMPNIRHLLRK